MQLGKMKSGGSGVGVPAINYSKSLDPSFMITCSKLF
jgi:hypothetical protein